MGIMTEAMAQSLIQAAFATVEPGGFVQFTFQGGEPTLFSQYTANPVNILRKKLI